MLDLGTHRDGQDRKSSVWKTSDSVLSTMDVRTLSLTIHAYRNVGCVGRGYIVGEVLRVLVSMPGCGRCKVLSRIERWCRESRAKSRFASLSRASAEVSRPQDLRIF